MLYRVGMPFWRWAARRGVRLLIRVDVVRDLEAGVLVATSPDLPGLVAEGRTTEEVFRGVYDCAEMLLEAQLHQSVRRPAAAWTGEFLPA